MSMSRERHWFERAANDMAVQCGLQFLAGMEVVALQHLVDAAVETLDHAVGLRVLRGSRAMLDAEVTAQLIELTLAGGSALAQAEQAVGKLLAARHRPRTDGGLGSLGENGPDPDWAGPFEIPQEATGIRGGLGVVDADEDPAGRPINGHEQVAARVQQENCPPDSFLIRLTISHLR